MGSTLQRFREEIGAFLGFLDTIDRDALRKD